jgi:hypothetical protein
VICRWCMGAAGRLLLGRAATTGRSTRLEVTSALATTTATAISTPAAEVTPATTSAVSTVALTAGAIALNLMKAVVGGLGGNLGDGLRWLIGPLQRGRRSWGSVEAGLCLGRVPGNGDPAFLSDGRAQIIGGIPLGFTSSIGGAISDVGIGGNSGRGRLLRRVAIGHGGSGVQLGKTCMGNRRVRLSSSLRFRNVRRCLGSRRLGLSWREKSAVGRCNGLDFGNCAAMSV